MLDENPELEHEVKETEKLINTKLKIKMIEEFGAIVNKITNLGFSTVQEAKEKAEKLNEVKTKEELISYLNAKKFCYYNCLLTNFITDELIAVNPNVEWALDQDGQNVISEIENLNLNKKAIVRNISEGKYFKMWRNSLNGIDNVSSWLQNYLGMYYLLINLALLSSQKRYLVIHNFGAMIKLNIIACLKYICELMLLNIYVSTPKILLALLSNPDRYNFFLQFHHMLEENLSQEDKQLFYDYLTSCRVKLLNEKDNYKIFDRQVRNLTVIVILGIIASATVLIINLLEIYAALWFFWFGIVGVILTFAVGINLFLCLKENWNDLKKLESDLLQNENGKTVAQKIDEIDRAIDVYDLEKIRNFKEPELKKIVMLDLNKKEKKRILNNGEINTSGQNGALKLEPIATEKNTSDQQLSSTTKNLF